MGRRLPLGWSVPQTLAAIAVRGTGGAQVAGALGEDAIAVPRRRAYARDLGRSAAPRARGRCSTGALRREAAVGPAVSWREAARSLRLARTLLALGAAARDVEGPRWASDHLAQLALDDPDGVLAELRSARLRPFEALGEGARARLELTLLEWLKQQGNRAATARALGVHEQTVRYRMNQLRELLGDALDEPQARFELELSLRAAPARRGWAEPGPAEAPVLSILAMDRANCATASRS